MKERPILFGAAMVRALLDGSKTQTRRIWKLPNWAEWDLIEGGEKKGQLIPKDAKMLGWYSVDEVACPYGQPGDHMWVREAWRVGAWNEDEGEIAIDYVADKCSRREWIQVPEKSDFERYWIQSTDDATKAGLLTNSEGNFNWSPGGSPCRGRPSIHMPRWAARISLEITNVRVERLQDINEVDAKAEGIAVDELGHAYRENDSVAWGSAKTAYAELWESINGPGSWDLNQWVWVVEFKRVQPGTNYISRMQGWDLTHNV